MSVKDMRIVLGGVQLPKYNDIKEDPIENASDIVTHGGTLYTDFINIRKVWTITWNKITSEDYDIIRGIYDAQIASGAYPALQIDAESVYEPVRMSISTKNPKFNGAIINNFFITLKAKYAFS